MADYELEQLKTLFDNLADKLDETSGDESAQGELKAIRTSLQRIGKNIERSMISETAKRKGHKDFIKDLFDEWDKRGPNETESEGPIIRSLLEENRRTTIKDQLIIDGKLKKNRDDVSDSLGGLNRSSKQAKGGLEEFIRGLRTMNFHFQTAVGSISAAGKKTFNLLNDQANNYRILLNSAEGSIDTIVDMRNVAAQAGMSVVDFVTAIQEGTDGVRSLGAARWADLNNSVRRASTEMGMLGYNAKQLVDVQASYLDMLRDRGEIFAHDTQTMTDGILKLVRLNDTMATIMGKTRDEQLKAMAAQSRDRNLTTVIQQQGIDIETANSLLAQAEEFGPGIRAMLADLLSFGQVVNEDAASAAAVSPEIYEAYQTIADSLRAGASGTDFVNQMSQMLQDVGREMKDDPNALISGQFGMLRNHSLQSAFTDRNAFMLATQNLKDASQSILGSDTRDPGFDNAALNAEDAARRMGAAIDTALNTIIHPMMQAYGPSLDRLVESIQQATLEFGSLSKAVGNFVGENSLVILGTVTIGLIGAFKMLFSPLRLLFRLLGAAPRLLGLLAGKGTAKELAASLRGGRGAVSGEKSLLKGTMRGAAGLGMLLEASDYLTGEKDLSWENIARSGIALTMGAAGGFAGSFVAPVAGTAAGGIAGYALGEKVGDLIFGSKENVDVDSLKSSTINSGSGSDYISDVDETKSYLDRMFEESQTPMPVNKTAEEMVSTQKNIDQGIRQLLEISTTQLGVMREEISVLRAKHDQLATLLEESNRNTRELRNLT